MTGSRPLDATTEHEAAASETAILTIDLDALLANYRRLRELAAPAECAAVVKADAYGLGLAQAAPALARAVSEKGIRAGLDVFAAEPTGGSGTADDPIFQLPGVIGTHHIGASTDQAQEAIAAETVRIIQSFKETGQVPNVVNLAQRTPATHRLVVRHRDRPGVLAQVLEAIKAEQINVQEMENVVFEGAEAAVARINLDKAPSEATLDRLRAGNADIIELDLLTLQS